MRSVKAVLSTAGILKGATPDAPEDALLLRALRDVNIPKLVDEDVPLFQGIIGDLFPGLEVGASDHAALADAIATTVRAG